MTELFLTLTVCGCIASMLWALSEGRRERRDDNARFEEAMTRARREAANRSE